MGICLEKDKEDFYLSGIIRGAKEKLVNEKNPVNQDNSTQGNINQEDTNINVNVTKNSLRNDNESNYNNNDDNENKNEDKNEDKNDSKNMAQKLMNIMMLKKELRQ